MALLFALLSLFFAAVNDLVFKFYARKIRSRGLYFGMIGFVWTTVFVGAVFLHNDNSTTWTQATVFWGLVSGFFSISANIFLIEAMGRMEAGTCATLYRLNLAFAAVLAFILLGEQITSAKLLGICLAILAVACFSRHSHDFEIGNNNKKIVQFAFLAMIILASLLRAGMGICYKYGLTAGADQNGLLTLNGIMWITGGAAYFLIKEKHCNLKIDIKKNWLYGAISGILICGIVLFMALALKHGDASVVLPVSQMSFIGTALLGTILLQESVSMLKLLGIACGIGCVLAMSLG